MRDSANPGAVSAFAPAGLAAAERIVNETPVKQKIAAMVCGNSGRPGGGCGDIRTNSDG